MTVKKKLKLEDLEVKSFVTKDRHRLRGGDDCSVPCFYDPSCGGCGGGGSGGGCGGGSGAGCGSNGCSNTCPTDATQCNCETLPGFGCPSQIGQFICA